MVRYELILHRPPKLSVADIPKRMGDLPEEFSEGTLQRALEDPEGGSISIAWGDRRKRLEQIKRRIEILGGSAELVDRAGPLAKKLTEIGDTLRDFLPKKSEEPEKTQLSDPSKLSFVGIGIALAACAGGIVYARITEDAHQRTYSLQGAGFALSLIMSQLFVHGVRRWYREEGRASVSALLVLLPMLSLFGAGYEAYTLGVVKRSAALLSGEGKAASAKPLMKPFAALIVELHHRKQRQELAAAMAGENDKGGEKAAGAAAATEQPSAEQPEAVAEAAPSAAPTAPGQRAKAGHKRKTAMISKQATHVDGPQLTAAKPELHVDTPETAMARWVGDVGQATPIAPATTHDLAAARAGEPRAQEPARKGVPGPAPAPVQISEPWDPLRRLEDVNEIHVAIAVSFAVLMFVIGMWSGRRARKVVAAAVVNEDEPASAPAPSFDAASEPPPEAEEAASERDFEPPEHPLDEADPWAEQPPAAAQATPVVPAGPTLAPAPRSNWDEASFAELTSPGHSPIEDPLALPDAFDGSLPPAEPNRRQPDTLPSLPPASYAKPAPAPSVVEDENQWPAWPADEPAAPQAPAANDNAAARPAQGKEQKPARKRAANAARGGIQEEMVVRRRTDARRDD